MIKLILFDLDGVLIKAKDLHYQALNLALGEEMAISLEDHHGRYDGLPTRIKLKMLETDKGFDPEESAKVWAEKQQHTLRLFSERLQKDNRLVDVMRGMKERGYLLGCCSNSIRRTVLTALSRVGLVEYMDIILSTDDVKNPKPHPEMYWKAMSMMGCLPEDTLVVEDNPHGLLSAARSGAKVLRVASPEDVTLEALMEKLGNREITLKWQDKRMNVLIPMAGAGSRFEAAGYTFPKPLIEVHGKPMIQVVVENLAIDARFIFVVRAEQREKYQLDRLLGLIAPECEIVEVDHLTEGAACTALLAKDLINSDSPLFFANSDQYVEWSSSEFFYKMQESGCDGGIVTFKATHPKWSFAKVRPDGLVSEVAEKNPISDDATAGLYYWKHGSDFVRFAESMIKKNIRVSNEFYVCPVFNEAISAGKRIKAYQVDRMWGLGTPEDLTEFARGYAQ